VSADAVVGLIALVAAVVVAGLVAGRRRVARARLDALQRTITDRLSADPALANLPLRAQVHKQWMRDVEVDLDGEVPSVWQRYAASRVVQRELANRRIPGIVVDRVKVAWVDGGAPRLSRSA
jgi:hypothetical protein